MTSVFERQASSIAARHFCCKSFKVDFFFKFANKTKTLHSYKIKLELDSLIMMKQLVLGDVAMTITRGHKTNNMKLYPSCSEASRSSIVSCPSI